MQVQAGAPEALALLQHRPVFTFGRRVRPDDLLVSRSVLHRSGVEVVHTDRGGGITFHGPGQIVAYPILDLRARGLGPAEYVRRLEESVVLALRTFGVQGERWPGRPGVWVGGAKIAAVGVRIRNGVATHGLAFNVEPDLEWFDLIIPCGIRDAPVTSLQKLLGHAPRIPAAMDALCEGFTAAFASELIPLPHHWNVLRISDVPAVPRGRSCPSGEH